MAKPIFCICVVILVITYILCQEISAPENTINTHEGIEHSTDVTLHTDKWQHLIEHIESYLRSKDELKERHQIVTDLQFSYLWYEAKIFENDDISDESRRRMEMRILRRLTILQHIESYPGIVTYKKDVGGSISGYAPPTTLYSALSVLLEIGIVINAGQTERAAALILEWMIKNEAEGDETHLLDLYIACYSYACEIQYGNKSDIEAISENGSSVAALISQSKVRILELMEHKTLLSEEMKDAGLLMVSTAAKYGNTLELLDSMEMVVIRDTEFSQDTQMTAQLCNMMKRYEDVRNSPLDTAIILNELSQRLGDVLPAEFSAIEGLKFIQEGCIEQALEALTRSINAEKACRGTCSPNAKVARATCLQAFGRHEEVIESLTTFLKECDDLALKGDALYLMAQSFEMLGDYEQARRYYKIILAKYPESHYLYQAQMNAL